MQIHRPSLSSVLSPLGANTQYVGRKRLSCCIVTAILTRSLPRDVYGTSQKRPSRWPRTYTSNLNFVSTYLSNPGHRRGCCCISLRCLLRQLVDRCLLSWALFLRKQVFYSSRRFCPNGGKQRCGCSQLRHKLVRALRLMAFVTTAIEERGGFVVFDNEGDGNGGGDWLGEETVDGGA